MSEPEAILLWYGLEKKTRGVYRSAIQSYEFFCHYYNFEAWPATSRTLEKWVATRAFGSRLPKQKQLAGKTIRSYLAALRSVHVDGNWPVEVFENHRLRRIIRGALRMFPHLNKVRLPITKRVLRKIIHRRALDVSELNFDVACKVAWAGFLRSGEFTYSQDELIDPVFVQSHLCREDITFASNGQYAIVRLKFSKTDYDHSGVEVVLAATGTDICPVAALTELFHRDPRPAHSPLFRLNEDKAFTREALVKCVKQRLTDNGLSDVGYSGHSFRKGAADQAYKNGLCEARIKTLGRWSSDAFKLYYKKSVRELYDLSIRHQRGTALPV